MMISFVCSFLILSVIFGFYFGPVRTDQVIVLFFGGFALLNLINSNQKLSTREIFVFLMLSLFIGIGFLSFLSNDETSLSLLVLSQIENYVSLFAIYLIWIYYFKNISQNQAVKTHQVFVFAMSFVTILNLIAWGLGASVLSIFHVAVVGEERTDLQGTSMLELLVMSGRYPGTFGQIFEAGIAYFLALLSALTLRKYYSKRLWKITILFLMLGGMLTGSKIFILGSWVLILYHTYFNSRSLFLFLVSLKIFLLSIVIIYDIKLPWQFNRLIRDVSIENIFNIYTSFRFADGSTIVAGMKNIYLQSPFIGMGFGYLANSDFALYEVMSISGLIGVVTYILTVHLIYFDSQSKRDVYRTLIILFFVYTISISAPAITANKVGFLLIVCLLSLKKIWRDA